MKTINLLFSVILSLTIVSCVSYKRKCFCESILHDRQVNIPVYQKDGSRIIITYDTITEDYYTAYIMKIKDKRAYVSVSATLYDTIPKTGWVETKYLGIRVANWNDDGSLYLYKKPTKTSKIKSIIIEPPYFYPISIIKCYKNWLYVSFLDVDNIMKEGWLSPDNQCSNPYSTCN